MISSALIIVFGVVGLVFSGFLLWKVSQISLDTDSKSGSLLLNSDVENAGEAGKRIVKIYDAIQQGAVEFLKAEYRICAIFIVVFGIIVGVLTSQTHDEETGKSKTNATAGALTAIAFAVGAVTSMLSGYIGMRVATYSNARTTVSAAVKGAAGWTESFNTAFRAGGVMGFLLSGLALLVCFALIGIFNTVYDYSEDADHARQLFECLSGYGLGGSSIAMFGRVGGGIYTKAADVGADLAGKVVENIPEDDPRNPATIADNVGDNVGDVAGMGSDLFGSFAEATCAALVVASQTKDLVASWDSLMFPLAVSAVGIGCCLVTSFFATDLFPCKAEKDVEKVLKIQLLVSSLLVTLCLYFLAEGLLPSTFDIGFCDPLLSGGGPACFKGTPMNAFFSTAGGLWAGCLIGFITEYFTSHSYAPVREVAQSCETGAATNIIYGLALGYKSAIWPVTLIAGSVFISFTLCGMYGVALAALGMLSTLATCLSIDVYGPVCDNAGGIAEMAELPEYVREKTDALDAAGNTTAAIGKGFAIGSAALVALALFGAFASRVGLEAIGINVLRPITFALIFIGAMIPYAFTAMTMKSVGHAAMDMVKEVKRQFDTIEGLREGAPGVEPDHAKCIKISTDASLREMIWPGLLVIVSPIACGIFFGVEAVGGLLTGSITSGVQLAISQSNTGGAWDNAKKYVEKGEVKVNGEVQGKGTEIHHAAVCGDTVGDPLKDTSGPAINIVMKLQAIIALVFADFFLSINNGTGLFQVTREVLHAHA